MREARAVWGGGAGLEHARAPLPNGIIAIYCHVNLLPALPVPYLLRYLPLHLAGARRPFDLPLVPQDREVLDQTTAEILLCQLAHNPIEDIKVRCMK